MLGGKEDAGRALKRHYTLEKQRTTNLVAGDALIINDSSVRRHILILLDAWHIENVKRINACSHLDCNPMAEELFCQQEKFAFPTRLH